MVAFLIWTPAYATGVRSIDVDHQVLFATINKLHASVANGEPPAELGILLRKLENYVESHFWREEDLLAKVGYPDLENHCAQHRRLAAKLADMIARYQAAPDDFDVDGLLEFIKSWLTGHVLETDMAYVPFVKAASAS